MFPRNLTFLAAALVLVIGSNIYAAEQLEEIIVTGEALFDSEPELPLGTAISGETQDYSRYFRRPTARYPGNARCNAYQ